MFPCEDVCQRSLQAIAEEGFNRKNLSSVAKHPVEAGFLSGQPGSGVRHLPAASATGAAMRCHRREKVFGPGRAVPFDRNAEARIAAYARAWSARNRQKNPPRSHHPRLPGRAGGPAVGVPDSRSGCCFPGYEAIAAKAECARGTVAEALKALEWAGVLSWQNRIPAS